MLRENTDDLLSHILESPEAAMFAERLNHALEEEKKRRLQFYRDITENDKAEFINGEMVVHSPVRLRHNTASGWLYRLLATFVDRHDLGFVGYEKIMIALTRNDYEPDVVFFTKDKAQHFQKDQWKFPAPDFVAEVLSEGTEATDRNIKYSDYEAHGVAEYWIIDAEKEVVEQYRLDAKGRYELVLKSGEGHIECQPVAGFVIDIEAIFDPATNFSELQRILSGK